MGVSIGAAEQECPVTQRVSDRLLRLPYYTDLSETDQQRVIDEIRSFFGR